MPASPVLRSPKPKKTPRRAFASRFVIASCVVVVLVVTGILAGNAAYNDEIGKLQRTRVTAIADTGPARGGNYLIVGSDSRQFVESPSQQRAFGSASELAGQRSDTLMVLHIDPATKKALVVSFPRDLQVHVPGRGYTKINAAFNDGPDKVIETLKDNFGIEIQHYIEVSFESFPKVVDAIGTVPVYFSTPARDIYTGLSIASPGCVALDGQEALQYVRSRHYEIPDVNDPTHFHEVTGSDIQRIARQQDFIRRLAAIASHKGASDFFKALQLADAVLPNLKVDQQLSRGDINALIKAFLNVDPNNKHDLEMITLPWEQDGDALVPKEPAAQQVAARLASFGHASASRATSGALHPRDVRVEVLNGSGEQGLAAATLDRLAKLGFANGGSGDTRRAAATEVRYGPGRSSQAKLVASYLPGVAAPKSDTTIAGADVVVVVGPGFGGVRKPPQAAPAAPATNKGKKASAVAPGSC